MPDRTELVWTYAPADFFEAPYRHSDPTFDLRADAGVVTVTLRTPHDPVEPAEQDQLAALVKAVFDARLLRDRRVYQLQGLPRIVQYSAGRTNTIIQAQAAEVLTVADRADFTITDSKGSVIRDTKAERLADDAAFLDLLAAPAANSPTIRAVLDSYHRSIGDPENEFLHLYEIRDALKSHFGGTLKAEQALGIAHTEWRRFGDITNGPATQGRHRGSHIGKSQPADSDQLQEVRGIAQRWLVSFARQLSRP